jgi:hypothetical protein
MATTQCPACGLTVPYYCCEGFVCPACGFDEAVGNEPPPEVLREESTEFPAPHALSPERPPSHRPVR